MTSIQLSQVRGEPRADTRVLAEQLGIKHQNAYETVKNYKADFEQLGILRFETGEIRGRGQPVKLALLNEDQCYLLLAFSRNTPRVRQLKVNLVLAFKEARISGRRTNAHDRLPMAHRVLDISADRHVAPSMAQGNVNRWAGVKRSRYMTAQQVVESVGYCDRLLSRQETIDDQRRIDANQIELYGLSLQLPLRLGVRA